MERLHILNLKSFQVEVIETEDSDGVLEVEAEHEAFEEVSTFLNSTNVFCSLARS